MEDPDLSVEKGDEDDNSEIDGGYDPSWLNVNIKEEHSSDDQQIDIDGKYQHDTVQSSDSVHRDFLVKVSDTFDIDSMIAAVRLRPVLWDKTCERYKDKFQTQHAWRDVCIDIFDDYDEYDQAQRMEVGKFVLKKWTQVRDSYRKSLAKAKSPGLSKAKVYIYAPKLQFLDKIFDEDSLITTPEKSLLFKKPKIRKLEEYDRKEVPNRHLSFFKGLLPSLEDFDEFETLDFQMEVLKIVKNIRLRKQPVPTTSTADTFFDSS